MKHPLILCALIAALALTGCKTNEANYRAAYEVAKAKQSRNIDLDGSGDTSGLHGMDTPRPTTVQGVTLPMRTETISFTKDGGARQENILRYNIVVGRFRQIFNATQMRQRLMDSGYPQACIVNNRDKVYFVIAHSCATPAQAAEALAKVKADKNLRLTSPLPFVLEPAHLSR